MDTGVDASAALLLEEGRNPDELVVVNFRVTRRTRLALKQLSERTGIPIARLMERGLRAILAQPIPDLPQPGPVSLERLETEEAGMEARALMQLKDAQETLRRVRAWRASRREAGLGTDTKAR
jgi:hypothetical protein